MKAEFIARDRVISAIRKYELPTSDDDGHVLSLSLAAIANNAVVDELCSAIKRIPPTHSSVFNEAYWVQDIDGGFVCSKCGCSSAPWDPNPDNPYGLPPYCHGCGSHMTYYRHGDICREIIRY